MIVDIKIQPRPVLTREQKYPLLLNDLKAGQFYESTENNVVFVSRGRLDHDNPLNIKNGIGGYAQGRERFRLLNPTKIEFTVIE